MSLYTFYLYGVTNQKVVVVTKTKTVRRHLERLKVFVRISYSLKTNPKTTLQINATLSQVTQIKSSPIYSVGSDGELGRL